ncbi:MAG: hypothetical protein ACR2JY_07635 [Chloroflexota bacterium]
MPGRTPGPVGPIGRVDGEPTMPGIDGRSGVLGRIPGVERVAGAAPEDVAGELTG